MTARGVVVGAEVMENGEIRCRMMFPDGSGYIRTESAGGGAWQNAHYHGGPDSNVAGVYETYIVQSGWAAFAWCCADGAMRRVQVCFAGEIFTTHPGEPHNVYLNGVIHTVKHGVPVGNPDKGGADWWPADPEFEKWTKSLTLLHIANQGGLSGYRRKTVVGT